MARINSNQKGKAGEREFAKWLRENVGCDARRGQQYSGGSDSPDVVTDLPFHFEVKRVERLNVHDALAQAIADSEGKTPIVAHRRNRGEWLITLRASDFFATLSCKK